MRARSSRPWRLRCRQTAFAMRTDRCLAAWKAIGRSLFAHACRTDGEAAADPPGAILGGFFPRQCRWPSDASASGVRLTVFCPACRRSSRQSPQMQFMFVNGRRLKDAMLNAESARPTKISSHATRHPTAATVVRLAPGYVERHVHAAKRTCASACRECTRTDDCALGILCRSRGTGIDDGRRRLHSAGQAESADGVRALFQSRPPSGRGLCLTNAPSLSPCGFAELRRSTSIMTMQPEQRRVEDCLDI